VRSYEVIFILDPALGDEGIETAITAVNGAVEKAGGQVAEIQKWGKKRLAYEVKKRREGHYVYLRVQAPAKAVAELERHLKIAEPVLKFLTVLLDAPRRRAARAPVPAPAPAETAAEAAAEAEATPQEA
jgi:small subunit ribosomal protein S6